MAKYGWHRPRSPRPRSPAEIQFVGGVDDTFPFEAIIDANDEDGAREMGIVWREKDAERIVRALNALDAMFSKQEG